MCYTLPKIWLGRIQKYWDKIIPNGYPVSTSEFSIKFDTEEIKEAVTKMEAELDSETSILKDVVPEGTVANGYVGTYDVKAEAGVKTLLSPEKVTTNNVIVMHYNPNEDKWVQVEDISIENGYIWGSLEDFSPIAVFTYTKTIHAETLDILPGATCIVCEGNAVKVTEDEEGKVSVTDLATGVVIELTGKSFIIGGSVDGTPIEKTSITVIGVKNKAHAYKIYGGSYFYPEDIENYKPTTVGSVNVTMIDSDVPCTTGSGAAVRTKEVNFNIENCTGSWVGAGESYVTAKSRDINTADCSFASNAWVGKVVMNIKNSKYTLVYQSGNTGYLYVDNCVANIEGGSHDYLLCCGSNGVTNIGETNVSGGAKIGIYQSTNRGDVKSSTGNFTDAVVENLFVGGDSTDSTVTGTTKNIRININAGEGSYNIVRGVEGGVAITAEDVERIVDAVKVSRNANVTINKELLDILGNKYITK